MVISGINSVESPASALLGDYYDFLDLGNLEWEFYNCDNIFFLVYNL